MNTNMNTDASRPLFYRVYKYELTTDKGEVGGSSPPRPTMYLQNFYFHQHL